MGSFNVGVSHETVVGPSLIIGKDVKNMGSLFCGNVERRGYERD
jgi:hypothetical protein